MKMAKFEMKLKFSPELIIYVGDFELGRISFKDVEDMGKFLDRLHQVIKDIIKEFEE